MFFLIPILLLTSFIESALALDNPNRPQYRDELNVINPPFGNVGVGRVDTYLYTEVMRAGNRTILGRGISDNCPVPTSIPLHNIRDSTSGAEHTNINRSMIPTRVLEDRVDQLHGNMDYINSVIGTTDTAPIVMYRLENLTAPRHREHYDMYYLVDVARESGGNLYGGGGTSVRTYTASCNPYVHDVSIAKGGSSDWQGHIALGPTETGTIRFESETFVYGDRNLQRWKTTSDAPGLTQSGSFNREKGTHDITVNARNLSPGTYYVDVEVEDQVKRASSSKRVTFTILEDEDDEDDGPVDPPTNPPPVVDVPCEFNFKYELDLTVESISGETVASGTNLSTPVEVHRKDFSSDRSRVKNTKQGEIRSAEDALRDAQRELEVSRDEYVQAANELAQAERDLSNAQQQLSSAESTLSSAQSRLSDARSAYNRCQSNRDEDDPPCSRSGINSAQNAVSNAQSAVSSARSAVSSAERAVRSAETALDRAEQRVLAAEEQLEIRIQELACWNAKYDRVIELENLYATVEPPVTLRYNGGAVSTLLTTLREGQTRTENLSWRSRGAGTIEAEINPPPRKYTNNADITKTTFSNNTLSTPIHEPSNSVEPCRYGASSASGIVRTIQDRDENLITLREYVTTRTTVSRNTMRAGQGFEVVTRSEYRNEDSQSSGVGARTTNTYFPNQVYDLGYRQVGQGVQVPMNANISGTPRTTETGTWRLPTHYVEEFSGHVFADPNAPGRDLDDNLLNGGNTWYVSFNEPDGYYQFNSFAYDAGVNNMTTCNANGVEVDGSMLADPDGNDDFIKRPIDPNNPFPSGTGDNWRGHENIISDLIPWANNWDQDFENWSEHNFSDGEIEEIQRRVREEGFNYHDYDLK
ncbi:hypothetical protein DH09_00475 (plasmid) [Bacillaceae bacterium JMAK1]|nr:hypothetical protein DH09_00475 [Bacillaceae bacterium JMAK1]